MTAFMAEQETTMGTIGALGPSKPPGELLFDVASVTSPERRVGAWTDALRHHYYPLDLVTQGPSFDVGRMYIRDIASIRVGSLECDPMEVHRRRNHIGSHADEFYMIPITSRSPLILTQFGREGRIEPGDLGFVGTGSSYVYRQPMRDRFTALRIPSATLRNRIPYADDLTASAFSGRQAMVSIFLDYARSCLQHGDALSAEEETGVFRTFIDLFALAISAPRAEPQEESSIRIAHRRRALRYIDTHIADPGLHSGSVAQALKISPRYLQKIFAEHGERLAAVIRARRIAEAQRLLEDTGPGALSITEIAFAVGFDDAAHFSRAFREETGTTARDYRSAARPHFSA